jgi:hypothetical protein
MSIPQRQSASLLALLLTAFFVAGLCVVPAAYAANRVVEDWRADGSIDGNYSVAELEAARNSVSAEELEYSDLESAIELAIVRAKRRKAIQGGKTGDSPKVGGGSGGASSSKSDSGESNSVISDHKSPDSVSGETNASEGALDSVIGSPESKDGGRPLVAIFALVIFAGIATFIAFRRRRMRNR